MSKVFKITRYGFVFLLGFVILAFTGFKMHYSLKSLRNYKRLGPTAPVQIDNGHTYRDLNKNGKLDVYEDSRESVDDRVADLMGQMNLEEKAGLMFITMIGMGEDGSLMEQPILTEPLSFVLKPNSELVSNRLMNHFNTVQSLPADKMAAWNNSIQKLAERTRLGIPVTIATDPRHGAGNNPGGQHCNRILFQMAFFFRSCGNPRYHTCKRIR